MTKLLLSLPPIISLLHAITSVLLFYFDLNNIESLMIVFITPITIVTLIHIYVAVWDSTVSKHEHIGYALVHIPLSILISFLALLFLLPEQPVELKKNASPSMNITQCTNKTNKECLNLFYKKDSL